MRSRICAGDSTAVRAAASSMASGRSSRSPAEIGDLVRREPRALGEEAYGIRLASDSRRISTSSRSRRRSRLVARTCRFGHRSTSFATSAAAAIKPLEVVEKEKQLAVADVIGEVVPAPSARDRLRARAPLPESGARSTQKTPALNSGTSSAAASSASRVFPVPPGPVRATRGARRHGARGEFGDVCLAADESARRSREIRVRDRLERWKLPLPELEERDGLVEILQAMLAEVEDWWTRRRGRPCRRREERLPPMPGCADSGG